MSPSWGPLLQAGADHAVRRWLAGAVGALVDRIGGLPEWTAGLVTDLVWWVLIATVIVLVVQVAMLYATLLERKFVGRIQDRIGPNRVGRYGLLQPFADMIKMLTKEDITPEAAHRAVYNLGPILVVPPTILLFAVIPAGRDLIASDLSVGFLFFIAIASTSVLPIFMAGWGSRNKYALIGAMRAVAQIVSYEIPQVLSVVGVLLLAGTLSMQGLTWAQGPLAPDGAAGGIYGAFPGVWFVFLQPIAFLIFVLATTAEIERTPFDIPEAESEIIAGYHTEYAGIKFGMFYLALYFALIAAAAVATVVFLGGWQPPLAVLGQVGGLDLGWLWFGLKTFFMVLVFMWLRGTLPRLRVDQLMSLCWKLLVPLSLANLLVAGLVGYLTQGQPPLFVLFGFTLANVLLVAATVVLVARWQGGRPLLGFEPPTPAEAGA